MASAKTPSDVPVISIRGGINDTDPVHAIGEDQCVVAENVEIFSATLGERRAGTTAVDMTSSTLTAEAQIVHLSQWFPTGNPTDPQWFGIAATLGTSVAVARNRLSFWTPTTPNDAIDSASPDIYHIQTQALGQLLFIACHTAQNRLHAWDGTNWRRTGVTQPSPPTAANTAPGGAYATTRYFRVRYVELNASSQVVRRSEPSTTLSFTPSGANTGAVVTKPATISEGETHWELEASTDNANFYRIATTLVATTTYTDTTAFASGYASQGPISEVIGTYLLQDSAKFLATDGDRLLLGGHWTDASRQSTVSWTPVKADPGSGNSERIPLQFNNTIDLDGYEGGALTGITGAVFGTWYAFKWMHIYQMTRTGDSNRAYDVVTLSKVRGAIPGTIIQGADETGSPCIYFLDPTYGPSRIGALGIQTIAGLRNLWRRVNLLAPVVGHGVYYPYKQQVHWWISIDGANAPNYKIVLQVSEIVSKSGMASRGWTTATGRIATAITSAMLTEQIYLDTIQTLSYRPYVGILSAMERCDTGSTDNGTSYSGRIVTRAFALAGILNKWGAMTASVMGGAQDEEPILVRWIRDFGIETSAYQEVDFTPEEEEELVVRHLDNLSMSEATYLQLEIIDGGVG